MYQIVWVLLRRRGRRKYSETYNEFGIKIFIPNLIYGDIQLRTTDFSDLSDFCEVRTTDYSDLSDFCEVRTTDFYDLSDF